MNYDSRGEAWQAAIEYHLRVGYKVLSLHLSLEACSLQTCFFFFLSFMFFFLRLHYLPPHLKYGDWVVAHTIFQMPYLLILTSLRIVLQ